MKLTEEQLVRYGTCATVDELQEKLQSDGIDISSDKVKTLFDSLEFTELDEEAFDTISGGCGGNWTCSYCPNSGSGAHWTMEVVTENASSAPMDLCDSCYKKYKNLPNRKFVWKS